MEIGQIDGVVLTEAGFQGGHEVTRAWFDPEVTSRERVAAEAAARNVATMVFADATGYRPAPMSDQKRQLGRRVATNLTPAQRTKTNAFIRNTPSDTARHLFPSQR